MGEPDISIKHVSCQHLHSLIEEMSAIARTEAASGLKTTTRCLYEIDKQWTKIMQGKLDKSSLAYSGESRWGEGWPKLNVTK